MYRFKFFGYAILIFLFEFFIVTAEAQVVSMSPGQHALNVPANTSITAIFNQSMNPGTVNNFTFRVWGEQSGPRTGIISYQVTSKKATFTPAQPFLPGETVHVTLTNGIKTAGGQALKTFSWQFMTAVSASSGHIASVGELSVGSFPNAIAGADFDQDGDIDLAVANRSGQTISILRNNGDGTFQAKQDYADREYLSGITTGDFDGDGDIDLITAHIRYGREVSSGDSTYLFKNNGDGTFQKKVAVTARYASPFIAAADWDGDGDLDLLIPKFGEYQIRIVKNNGAGAFLEDLPMRVESYVTAIHAADLNNDGDLDLVVTAFNIVCVLIRNGDGFQPMTGYFSGGLANCITVADLDGDSDGDIIVSTDYGTRLYWNQGDGSFADVSFYVPGAFSGVNDFDGDGALDLVVTNLGLKQVSILKNNGLGVFQAWQQYYTGLSPTAIFAADFDKDGDADLAVANRSHNNMTILTTRGFTPLVAPPVLDFGQVYTALGKDSSFTVYNYSQSPLQVTSVVSNNPKFAMVSSGSFTLGVGDSANVTVRYKPDAVLTDHGTIRVSFNGFPDQQLAVRGTGRLSVATVAVAPAAVNFSTVTVGKTADRLVNISSTGQLEVMITSLAHDNPNFAITGAPPLPFAVRPRETKTIAVRFTASFLGGQSDTLRMLCTADNARSIKIPLNASGVNSPNSEISVQPLQLQFGDVLVNQSRTLPLKIYNRGAANLTIGDITSDNTAFMAFTTHFTLLPGDSNLVNVGFNASAVGSYSGTLMIANNDADENPLSLKMSGTAASTLMPVPVLTRLAPNTGGRLQTLNVGFKGDNFIAGVTSVNVGANIAVNRVTVHRADSLTANLTILAKAERGPRSFSVTNILPGGGTSGAQAFVVANSEPTQPRLLSPANGQLIQLSKQTPALRFLWSKSWDADPEDAVKYAINLKGPGLDTTFAAVQDTGILLNILPHLQVNSEYAWNLRVSDGWVTVTWPDRATFRTSSTIMAVYERDGLAPGEYRLEQNFPNPFALVTKYAETTINYQLPKSSLVTLKIFDVLGREMITLVQAQQPPGYHHAVWNGKNSAGQWVPGGVYLCRLQAGSFERVMKMMVVR
ncbi:MAG: hypothetical protein ILNGONEN_01942 [Syntrophorhabdaceae bacterium]|nr:hypothetical protein [Syntrophorhabdaceae bacterium]